MNRSKNIEELKLKIEKALKSQGDIDKSKGKSPEEMLEEISIYYQELEFQNDELMRVRNELEESHKRYTDLYENAPVSYVTYDKDLNIISANKLFLRLTGFEPGGSKKIPLNRFIDPESQNEFHFHIQSLLKSFNPESCQLELKGLEKKIPVKVESNIYKDEKEVFIRSAFIDLTNEKEAENYANQLNLKLKKSNNELAEYKDRLEATMMAGNIAWWQMNAQTGEVKFNEQKTRMLGYKAENFNHYKHFTDLVHPDDYEPMMENMRRYLRGDCSLYQADYKIKTNNGDYKSFHDIGIVTSRDSEGRPLILTGVVIDVTKLRAKEESLNERVKELQCLHMISKLIESSGTELAEIFAEAVKIIPFGMRFSELVTVRLQYQGRTYASSNKCPTDPCLSADLKVYGKAEGCISVFYSEKPVFLNGEFFINEEKDLLLTISELLSKTVEKIISLENLKKSEEKSKFLLDAVTDPVLIHDMQGKFINCNQSAVNFFRFNKDEVKKLKVSDFDVHLTENQRYELLNEIRKKKELLFETKLKDKHNRICPVEINTKVIELDGKEVIIANIRDISERKKSEEVIIESERKFRSIFEQSAVGICYSSLEGNFISVNQKFCDIVGYSSEELRKLDWPEITHPDDVEVDKKFVKRLLDKKIENYSIQKRYVRKNKEMIWVNLTVSLLSDSKGEPRFFIGIITDISKEKKALSDLGVSESKYRNLFENMEQGVVYQDRHGSITEANTSAARILGLSMDQLLGRKSMDPRWKAVRYDSSILPGEQHPAMISRVTGKAVKDFVMGVFNPEEEVYHWILVNSLPIKKKNAKPPYPTFSTFTDFTQRKNITDQLRESEAILQSIINTLPGTLTVIDLDYNIINANEEALKMKKAKSYNLKEVIGKKCYDVFSIKGDPCSWCRVPEVIKTGESVQETTDPNDPREKDTGRALQLYVSPITNNEGNIIGVIEYGMDITSLRNAKLEAERATRIKSEFLANMSHEIRTPLNGVIGFTELLAGSKLNEEQKKYAKNANVSAHALLGIINDILDFSKIEAGKMDLEELQSDVYELVEHTVDIVKFSAIQKGLELIVDFSPELPRYAVIDPLRIKQILINLLGNAIKFTMKGEVVLFIDFYQEDPGSGTGELIFGVKDTGIGISAENQKKLFKVFSQADSSTTRKFGGTGLGLAISAALAELMGSKINFESKEGAGSMFSFRLKKSIISHEDDTEKKFQRLKKVLLTMNSKSGLDAINKSLKYWDFDTRTAKNGVQALEFLQSEENFDLLILDQDLPGLNGLEIVKVIRDSMHITSEALPIIMTQSPIGESMHKKNAERMGISDVLNKPLMPSDLYRTMEMLEVKDSLSQLQSQDDLRISEVDSQKYRILIAEDSEVNMMLLKAMINKISPYSLIVEAVNGREAVEKYKEQCFDVIFMDVQMPLLDGCEATKRIREMESAKQKKTTIVAITAGALKDEKEKCLAAGMDDYISKPINSKTLRNVWEKVISKKKNSQNSRKKKK